MLTTYLQGFVSKFIIIEDDLEEPGDKLFKYLKNNIINAQLNTIYLQFSFNLSCNISSKNQVSIHHDMTKLSPSEAVKLCSEVLFNNIPKDSILIIDSLAHMIYKLDARKCYEVLIRANKTSELKQILGMLHIDLLEDNDDIIQHLVSLTTLHVKMERQFGSARRLSYLFKKGRGKVVREIEEFCFPEGKLVTRPVAKLDVKTVLQGNDISLKSLTTFNIELNEQDKLSRSKLDLPFLPKELQNATDDAKQSEIHYVFDAGDDWDAEDPDDDLDI